MTIQEVHQEFKFRLDKMDSFNYPNLLPEEIDLLLNNAQDVFVKQRYGITNTKKQGLEDTQKRTEDLKSLVRNAVLVPIANSSENIDDNAQFVILPQDHWFIIEERCKITYTNCNNELVSDRVYTKDINHDEFNDVISNPFQKPNLEKCVRLMENGKVEILHSPLATLNEYHLRYIKKPVRVDLTSSTTFELSEHTHTEIVSIAVDIALENIESKRLQTHTQITNIQE